MRPLTRFSLSSSWFGVMLGLLVCGLPLMAMAVEFKPPRRGIPGRREGAGTRDPYACVQGNLRLTAIMPQTNLGLTTAVYPRFFWYSPRTRAKFAQFTLYEVDEATMENKISIYTSTFRISGTSGIASLPLPNTTFLPPLTVGKDYHWSLALICNPDNREQNITVDGWVQRIAPAAAFTNQLGATKSQDLPTLYANNGLWFDTVTTLAEQRCANPNDTSLAASWAQLLKSVKLDTIAEQPLVQQCGKE